VRHDFVARLSEAGLSQADLSAAELVFGELTSNVYRHAPGRVEAILDVSGPLAVLHVLDSGEGFDFHPALPNYPMPEHGRGLLLIKRFADEFSVERRRSGGSHARAVLLGSTRVRATTAMTRRRLETSLLADSFKARLFRDEEVQR
jgi:anti-sigma regulatory factor (Ser/Thr protein kinase)